KSKRLTGETLGIIGLGRIGTAVAMRAKGFGVRVVFYDPYLSRGIEKSLGLERKDNLIELLAESDILSFHTPLTNETRNMADDNFFVALKPGTVMINTARGGLIDLDALYRAMKKNKVRAAGLDVLSVEPPNAHCPLIKAWKLNAPWLQYRLQITPHCAFYSQGAFYEMRRKAALEIKRVFEGKAPLNCINM
ncbi:MAG: NAD(P)-dependent oxidoreductase, partial [Bacteroidales bacterium]